MGLTAEYRGKMNDFKTLFLTKQEVCIQRTKSQKTYAQCGKHWYKRLDKMDYDYIFFFRNANSSISPNK